MKAIQPISPAVVLAKFVSGDDLTCMVKPVALGETIAVVKLRPPTVAGA